MALVVALGVGYAAAEPATRPLTLRQAVQTAAQRNVSLLVRRLDRDRAALGVAAAERRFTPELTFDFELAEHRFDTTPGRNESSATGGARLTWQSLIGTSASVGLSHDVRSIDDNPPPDPGHAPRIDVSLRQALWRGAGELGAARERLEADAEARLQRARFTAALEDFLVEVEGAYWDLAFAEADVGIKTRSRDRARIQFEETRTNIDRGLLAPTELYIVEENLVRFEHSLVDAQEARSEAASGLARRLEWDAGEPSAVDGLAGGEGALPEAADAIAIGLQRSPVLEAARLESEREGIRLAFEENRVAPRLDLAATFALNGLGDDPLAGYTSLDPHSDRETTLGVEYSIPIGHDADEARMAQARMAQRQRVLDRAREAVRAFAKRREAALDVDRLRVEAARKERDQKATGLEMLRVTAPQAGLIYRPFVQLNNEKGKVAPGKVVRPGSKLVELPDMSAFVAHLYLRQRDAAAMRVGDPATLRLTAAPTIALTGRVADKDAFATTRNERLGTDRPEGSLKEIHVTLDVDVPSPAPDGLRPGASLAAIIETGLADDVVRVPLGAVIADDEVRYVQLEDGRRREVKLGRTTASLAEVTWGLSPGDVVRLGPVESGSARKNDDSGPRP